jgi:pimeloyl-ACP methyl ester carboxylesterase
VNLGPALDGERLAFDGLSCYVAGSGPPLLLVHSINATGSAAEVRPLFEHAQATHTAFALDLPGYGFSDRSDCDYTPRRMTDAFHSTSAQIARRCGPQPVDALAVSLSCEYLARAAVEEPSRWRRLALVSPTGLNGTKPRRAPPGQAFDRNTPVPTRAVPGLYRVLSTPLWAQALFDGLTRPSVVRYFLERTWGSKLIDETMWAYALQSARAPGARFAPLHFLGGGLFSADIHSVYAALAQPVWVSHGVRGDFTDYRGLPQVMAGRSNWRVSTFPAGALPYFERPTDFNAAFDAHFG